MRTLLFDIDGTLLLTNGGGSRAIQQAIEQEFHLAQANLDLSFAGRTDRSLIVEILSLNGLPTGQEHQQRLRGCYTRLFPSVLASLGGRVLPGVSELLSRLVDHPGLRCCVMTGNLHETAERKLEHFGLLSFFDVIYGGDHDHDRNDLALRTASALQNRYGADTTRDLVVIGDTPADIRCGHAIGACSVAVCTGSFGHDELQAENPTSIYQDFADVDAIFELLTSTVTNGRESHEVRNRPTTRPANVDLPNKNGRPS